MDGKNIADFIDPDIMARLEELEAEEEAREAAGEYVQDIESRADFEVREKAKMIKDRRKIKAIDARLNKSSLHLPRKALALNKVLQALNLKSSDCAVMGDDWPDFQMMKGAGLRICPAQGHEAVKETAHFVTKKSGGNGAVREVCDLILKAQNRYEELLAQALS